ncbi:Stp1/IreP family PP2C-type Ser/Thr phosphatase [Chloroflexota bacterium]
MNAFEISYKTDIGSREVNEDNILVKAFDNFHLLAVADGLAGHTVGEVASSMALDIIEKVITPKSGNINHWYKINRAISKANREIYSLSGEIEYYGMGTTVVMALVDKDKAYIANVGDSRAYLITKDQIKQLTVDHSFVQEMIESGTITADEAHNHPYSSVLTRAVGTELRVKIDNYEQVLGSEDILVLCTDGLTRALGDEEILEIISSTASLDKACDILIDEAKKRDIGDNISVILVRRK